LWFAWTLAAIVGVLLVAGLVSALGAFWDFVDQFGLAPPSSVLELVANVLLALCLSLAQLVVLRVVLDHNSGAARAWVPVATLGYVLQYFVSAYWLRSAPAGVALVVSIVLGALAAGAQGLVLREMLHVRSAMWIWLGGTVAFYLATSAFYATRLVDPNSFPGAVVLGFLYGATTGAAVTFTVRRSVRRPSLDPLEDAIDPL
jgi:hypothetical protein